MAVVGTWTGLEVRVLRQALRLTWDTFAERLGASVRTIGNWESRGASITPKPEMQAALDTLLARADTASQTRFHMLLADAHGHGHGEVRAQGVARSSTATDGDMSTDDRLSAALSQRVDVDLVAVAHLRQKVQDLDARYDHSPSASLLAEAGQRLGQVDMLRTNVTSGRVHRELSAVEAEAAILMGQLVWDASQRRDHATARAYFGQAVRAAQQVGDRAAEGLALLRTSFVALYGEKTPEVGLVLATRAAEKAKGTSVVISGLATLHVAEAQAMAGNQRDCDRALEAAASLSGKISVTDPAIDLFSPSQHGRLAGSCYLSLGRTKQAVRTLHDASASLRQGSKSHAIALANLALAHVRQRDFDEAVNALHQALDVVEMNRGGGGLNIISQAGRELQPWRRTRSAQDVYDRLLALMAPA
jgi:tetratricopeptide (TPR) repeat protein/DNA-binding XRE family transcriptional regulator